jgi:hypothetical protein
MMAAHPAEHAQQDATLRTTALGTLILNAFSVRAPPCRFIRCRGSAIQNNVQTNTYDSRRHGATPSLLSCRRSSGYFRRLGHFFSSPESCFARQRVRDSSARGSRVEASVNGYRTALHPSQTVRSRMTIGLVTPFTALFYGFWGCRIDFCFSANEHLRC